MGFFRFYWQVARMAFRHSLDATQTILFVLFIGLGLATARLPPMMRPFVPDAGAWEVAAYVLGGIILLRLILSPYWLWKEQRDLAKKATAEAAGGSLQGNATAPDADVEALIGSLREQIARLSIKINPESVQASPSFIRLKFMIGTEDDLLTPEGKLFATRDAFEALSEKALAGDFEAYYQAAIVAEWLREAAKKYWASGAGFHDMRRHVEGRLLQMEERFSP